jgi:hypothetical protein
MFFHVSASDFLNAIFGRPIKTFSFRKGSMIRTLMKLKKSLSTIWITSAIVKDRQVRSDLLFSLPQVYARHVAQE